MTFWLPIVRSDGYFLFIFSVNTLSSRNTIIISITACLPFWLFFKILWNLLRISKHDLLCLLFSSLVPIVEATCDIWCVYIYIYIDVGWNFQTSNLLCEPKSVNWKKCKHIVKPPVELTLASVTDVSRARRKCWHRWFRFQRRSKALP